MTKEPYHVCVSSVKAAKDLDTVYEGGGAGPIVEARRWVSVSDMQKNAEAEGRPFVVVFSDPDDISTLLYHAEVGKIKIHRTKNETTFAITNMQPFAEPKPGRMELFSHRHDEDFSDPNRSAYIFCKTPPVLLEAKHSELDNGEYATISSQNVRSEIYKVIHQESLRRVRSGSDPLFDVSKEFIEHLEQDGYSIDEDMVEEMKADCRDRDSDRLSSHLRHLYGLSIVKEEVAQCETVEDFIDLVKTKFVETKPVSTIETPDDESPLEATPVAEADTDEIEEAEVEAGDDEAEKTAESKIENAVSV